MEFLRAIGPVFNFLLLALALIFFTRKQIRKLFQERRDRIADALGRAADAQDQARHTAEDIAEAQQAADAEARAQLAEAKAQAETNTAAADAETAREAEAVRRGVTCVTAMSAANTYVSAIEAVREDQQGHGSANDMGMDVIALQDLPQHTV